MRAAGQEVVASNFAFRGSGSLQEEAVPPPLTPRYPGVAQLYLAEEQVLD